MTGLCDYCNEELFETIYSIPLDPNHKIFDGCFCCPQCRLAANRYINNEPRRSVREWQKRLPYIRALDLPKVYDEAPPPQWIRKWNENGYKRSDWLKHNVKLKKRI